MNVFDITVKYDSLMLQIEELEGEITPELAAQLEITEKELAQKVRAYYFVIKTKEAEINLAKEEQERLNNVKKTKENVIKRLKSYVNLAVEAFGTLTPTGNKKLDLGDLKVWQKKTEALGLTEGAVIDDERFCVKEAKFSLSYNDVEELLKMLNFTKFVPTVTTILIKDRLKDWLLENEEEHKALRDELNNRLSSPDYEISEVGTFSPVEESVENDKKEDDIKILQVAKINHNVTVIFR